MSSFWFDTDALICYQVNVIGPVQRNNRHGPLVRVHDTNMPESHDYVIPADWLKDNDLDAIEAREDELAVAYGTQRKRLEDIREWLYKYERVMDRLVRRKVDKTPIHRVVEKGGIFGGAEPTNSNIDFIPDPTEGRF